MKRKERKERKERKKKVFKNVQQNIAVSSSKPYFATHYTPATIRSKEYSQPRFISASFNPYDSVGLESEYPRIASDSFIIQLPQHRIEPTRLTHLDRRAFNIERDVITHTPPQPPQQPQPPQPPPPPEPEINTKKKRGPYKKKVKENTAILEE